MPFPPKKPVAAAPGKPVAKKAPGKFNAQEQLAKARALRNGKSKAPMAEPDGDEAA